LKGGGIFSGKHWLGLSIDKIPAETQISEITKKILDEGGVSIAPHPYSRQGYQDFITNSFDAVEGLNGTTARGNEIFQMEDHHNLPVTAGSDAHAIPMLGYTWTLVDAAKNIDDILEAIRKGQCRPEGTLIPFIHRHIRFYTGLTTRYIASCPSELLSLFRRVHSGSPQITMEV
jgi:hypothetical protein